MLRFLVGVSKLSAVYKNKWVLDSGASTHTCNSELSFTGQDKKRCDRDVSVGYGSSLAIMVEGSVRATTVVDATKQKVVLNNVLLVLQLFWILI